MNEFNSVAAYASLFEKSSRICDALWLMHTHVSLCSYKRDAMEKLAMSNGGATDVYLSNSRCVKNNDKPVDNNVFTGRLPVSTGPQHHQWQQHQHQLLLQADDNTQLFADNGHCA